MKNCVYRFLNSDNEIIYIGKAKDLKLRLNNHIHLPKECYKEKDRVEYTTFSTMDEADIAERYLISKNKPKYNVDFKSNEVIMTIDVFENLEWVDLNSKTNITVELRTKREILKVDLNIQKINEEIQSVRNEIQALDIMMNEILKSNGKGDPCLINTDKDKRYHIYRDDELYHSLKEVNRNSKGLDEYASLYEKWTNKLQKESKLLEEVESLKGTRIDLLLKLHDKSCSKDMRDVYIKYNSINDDFILKNIINSIENKYKKQLSEEIINHGYYDYNEFIQLIDGEFNYDYYINSKMWLRLIDNIESDDVKIQYANRIIKNIENYLEQLFGIFKVDTIIKDGHSRFNYKRILPTAYLIKKPINI